MSLPDITALAGLIISALVFILLASRTKSSVFTLRGYTMAENEVVGDQYGASFVAASSSLATVLLFFLSNAKYYGLILLWCGATYLIGQYIFTQYVRKKDVIKDDVRTVADLWFYTIKSKSIARLITALTFATFLMILFIELYVGSAIFSYFFSPFTVYSDEISFLTVGLIVVYYVRIGGLKAVVQTDGWQLVLMLGAVAALFAFALVSPSESSFDFGAFLSVNASKLELIAFCIWILIINLSLPFTQLSSWQRVAACKSGEEVWNGFKSHVVRFAIIWFLPVISFSILVGKGVAFIGLSDFLDTMKETAGLSSVIFYPILVIGFGSALFSTADTALIALTTNFADSNTFKSKLEELSSAKLKRTLTIFSIIIMVLLSLVFMAAKADLGKWFLPMVYNIFGQLGLLAPLLFYALRHLQFEPIHLKRNSYLIIFCAIVISWGGTIIATLHSVEVGNQIWSQAATPAGMVLTGLALIFTLKFCRK